MTLRLIPSKNVWVYQTKINGKTWARSTGHSDKKKALKEVPKLQRLAEALRKNPDADSTLEIAVKREIERVREEVSENQGLRVRYSMNVFMSYAGKNKKLEKIDTQYLELYQKKRLKKAAYSTVNRELVYIIRMLRVNGLIIQKPSPKPGKVTYQRAFSKDELHRFFAACPVRLKPLYLLMLASGARKAELVPSPFSTHVALLKKEVDLEKRVMILRTAKQRTGMMMTPVKPRIIPLPEWVIDPLRQQMKRNKGKHVFPAFRNHPRDFNLIIEQAKIEKFDALGHKVTAHSFRHTYATLMAEMVGHNAFVLKEALGHARITTTERYCHPTSPILELNLDLGDKP